MRCALVGLVFSALVTVAADGMLLFAASGGMVSAYRLMPNGNCSAKLNPLVGDDLADS